ncbi:MAG: nuclear transport factor 2 family protein [Actinomycetota bacterium]
MTVDEQLMRTAWGALAGGDLPAMLELVDPDLEWAYLDPSRPSPHPQVCHSRHQLEDDLRPLLEHGIQVELEEAVGSGDRVVDVRMPGLDAYQAQPGRQAQQGDDRRYNVVTLRAGRIVGLRDCRSRREALEAAGLG